MGQLSVDSRQSVVFRQKLVAISLNQSSVVSLQVSACSLNNHQSESVIGRQLVVDWGCRHQPHSLGRDDAGIVTIVDTLQSRYAVDWLSSNNTAADARQPHNEH